MTSFHLCKGGSVDPQVNEVEISGLSITESQADKHKQGSCFCVKERGGKKRKNTTADRECGGAGAVDH